MIEPTRLVSRPIDSSFFAAVEGTLVSWLGGAGVLINARGTILLIDPMITTTVTNGHTVSDEWPYRLKFDLPLHSRDVPRTDAVLYTHADADHFARETAGQSSSVCGHGSSRPRRSNGS